MVDEAQSRMRVTARSLSKEYVVGVKAIQGVDLYAESGEIVGLLGPNGAGKSTTLNVLATLIRRTGGSAEICGISIDDAPGVRRKIGVALQDVGLDPMMTAKDHLDVLGALYALSRPVVEERGTALLAEFGLASVAGVPVGRYSAGMQRRLALILALVANPPVILLDEPTAGLDPVSRRIVWRKLQDLREQGTTVIFSTHYLEEAQELCDRLYLIFGGEIVRSGAPGAIRGMDPTIARRVSVSVHSPPKVVARILAEMGIAEIGDVREAGADVATINLVTDGDGVELTEHILEQMRRRDLKVREVHFGAPSLEDVFLALDQPQPDPEPLSSSGLETAARRVRGGRRWR